MDSLNDSDSSSTSSDSEEEEMDVEEEEDENDIGVQDPYEGCHGNIGSNGSNMGNNYLSYHSHKRGMGGESGSGVRRGMRSTISSNAMNSGMTSNRKNIGAF